MFKDIIGQQNIKQQLIKTIKDGRISHAQLFYGKEGIGKLGLAISYAQYLCCKNPTKTDACGTCSSCLKYKKLAHPDLHFVYPVIKPAGKSSVVSDDFIEDFREALANDYYLGLDDWYSKIGDGVKRGMIYNSESSEIIRKLSLKPYESQYKIMIIWYPELMNSECANKILKILEEPAEYTIFLMVSNKPENMLTTILSRTQQVKIDSLAENEISEALKNNFSETDNTKLQNIAHIASGSYLRAKKLLFDSAELKENYEHFVFIFRKAWMVGNRGDHPSLKDLKDWSDKMAGSGIGRDRQINFLAYAQKMIRENYIYNIKQPQLNYMTDYEESFATNFSPFVHERNVEDLIAEFALAERHIEQNVNAKMVFFDLTLKLIMLLKR